MDSEVIAPHFWPAGDGDGYSLASQFKIPGQVDAAPFISSIYLSARLHKGRAGGLEQQILFGAAIG